MAFLNSAEDILFLARSKQFSLVQNRSRTFEIVVKTVVGSGVAVVPTK